MQSYTQLAEEKKEPLKKNSRIKKKKFELGHPLMLSNTMVKLERKESITEDKQLFITIMKKQQQQ